MIDIISDLVVILCLLALFTAILINFFETKRNVQKRKKSIVETGSMTGFFILFYLLLRFKIGYIDTSGFLLYFLKLTGFIILITGTYINIKGRINLGLNWANQVTIYTDQTLITSGIYKYIRHPLYGSIICMFYGGSFLYSNYLAFLSNTLIFIPFMYYRAQQEEKLLKEKFPEYCSYIKKTGMLFPKLSLK